MRQSRVPVTLVTGRELSSTVAAAKRVIDTLGDANVAVVGRDVPHGRWRAHVRVEPRIVYRSPGCGCCALRADLVAVLPRLSTGRGRPDWIVVVDPPGAEHLIAIQSFLGDSALRRTVVLDSVVSTVDAPALSAQLAGADELASFGGEVGAGLPAWTSTFVVDGLDLLTAEGKSRVLQALREAAPLARVVDGSAPILEATGVRILDPLVTGERLEEAVQQGGPVIELHDALDGSRVDAMLKDVVGQQAESLQVFMASIVLEGQEGRFVAHGARSSVATGWVVGRPDADPAPPTSRVLLFGQGIDLSAIRRDLVGAQR